jgi:uncharacterized spore protein YtfJ
MTATPFVASVADKLQSGANVAKVFGEPITAQGKTIIPVARVAYGFGGGGGTGRPGDGANEEGGTGLGGGGGIAVIPTGVVEITPDTVRYVAFGELKRLGLAFAAGLLLGTLVSRRRG